MENSFYDFCGYLIAGESRFREWVGVRPECIDPGQVNTVVLDDGVSVKYTDDCIFADGFVPYPDITNNGESLREPALSVVGHIEGDIAEALRKAYASYKEYTSCDDIEKGIHDDFNITHYDDDDHTWKEDEPYFGWSCRPIYLVPVTKKWTAKFASAEKAREFKAKGASALAEFDRYIYQIR